LTDKENQIWLTPSNEQQFRFHDWIKSHDYVYWYKNAKYKVGDTVYVYSAAPVSSIVARFIVEQVGITKYDDSEEVLYRVNPKYDLTRDSVLFTHLELPVNQEGLSFNALKEYGLKAAPQGARHLSGELLEYIEKQY
jgi:hypothetical protein